MWGSGKAPVLDWTHLGLIVAQPLTSLVALDKPSLRTSVSSENAGAMFEFPESGPETKTWGQVFTGEVTWGAEMQDVEGKPIKGVCFLVSAGDHRAQLCRRLRGGCGMPPTIVLCRKNVGAFISQFLISAGWESPRRVNSPHSELRLRSAERFYSRGKGAGR